MAVHDLAKVVATVRFRSSAHLLRWTSWSSRFTFTEVITGSSPVRSTFGVAAYWCMTSPCHGEDCGFEPRRYRQIGS